HDGASWTTRVYPDDLPAVDLEFSRALNEDGLFDMEYRFRTKDGRYLWFHDRGSMNVDESGALLSVIGIMKNINERKLAEEALREAKEMAEEANRAKSEFLAKMSHEIRTPMNAITGLTHLALQTELTSGPRDDLDKIKLSTRALLIVINDVLDLSKIEAGKLDIEKVPFNLDDVITNIFNLVVLTASEKELELMYRTNKGVPRLLVGDPLRLEQILLNLVNNAVKFTESGEVIIQTELVNRTSDKITLCFSVRDTGIGISEDQIASLFEPFTQVDGSISRKYGGSGLGLAISKRLVEMMGGQIVATSLPGRGSLFTFTVTLALQPEHTADQLLPPAEHRAGRVLIVDDNDASREILKDTLESFSFQVTTAVSGQKALEELDNDPEGRPYRLILMDWKMPGMDGFEVSRQIRRNPATAQYPIIIMVPVFGREDAIRRAEEAGLKSFLVKPVSRAALFNKVMDVLGQANAKDSLDPSQEFKGCHSLSPVSGSKILVVEDNEINQQVAREILERAGVSVTVAGNGREAVRLVDASAWDVVLMDIHMPEVDGYEATRRIRQTPQHQQLPIIAMTANALKGEQEKCLAVGMNDYVSKPIDVTQLFQVLSKWVKPRKTTEKNSPARPAPAPAQEAELFPYHLPSFNVPAGLARLGENSKLYRDLLLHFQKDYAQEALKVKNALLAGDQKSAQELAHKLKGTAGNLS
ncbi:MAG: response regulator, partial [Deltaproteobacteria bacterium]|nr:response regulator [Deltaproteobacteria bacterium]